MSKSKIVASLVVGAILLGAMGIVAFQQLRTPGGKTRQVRVAGAAVPTSAMSDVAATNPAWRERFDAVYRLAPGQVVKLVPPPWIAERLEFHRDRIGKDNTTGATALMIRQEANGTLRVESSLVGFGGDSGGGFSVSEAIGDIVGISPRFVDLPPELMKQSIRGDWVYRRGLPPEQSLAAVMQAIAPAAGRTYELVRRPMEREVILVSGKFKFQPLAGVKSYQGRPAIHLFLRDEEPASLPDGVGGGTATVATVLDEVGEITGYPIVFDGAVGTGVRVNWRQQESAVQMQDKRVGPADAAEVDVLLANVAKQTSLELKRGKRVIEMWMGKE